jgi:hypothetical protein
LDKQKQASGVLAGRVVDAFQQPRPGAAIELIPLDGKSGEKPKQAIADNQGHFIIRGLEPGRKYKLAGRTRSGDAPLQGTLFATPPNVVLLLTLNEDVQQGEQTKPTSQEGEPGDGTAPGKSTGQGKQYLHEEDKGSRLPPTVVPNTPPQPAAGGKPPAQLGQPTEPENKPETPPVKLRPDSITDKRTGQGVPPYAQIPQPTPFPSQPNPSTPAPNRNRPAPTQEGASGANGDTQLQDLDGKPVQLSTLRGKLVLLDLWSTSSRAPVMTLREVAYLHKTYGPSGLEVIGVAYEDGPWATKVERVKFVAQRQGADYTLWMGTGDNCPLLKMLDIQRIPTTVLLDPEGKIIWRTDRLTPESRAQLEAVLRQRLGVP